MKNTARMYSAAAGGAAPRTGRGDGAPPVYEATTAGRPGSVKKQKQLHKSKESLLAMQNELSTLVGKLEDRDTQQQAFTSLLELLPRLDNSLVADLYVRIEKNKNPGRSSTRRMFVLVIAAMAKCHPIPAARLLPRVLAYISLRLRDKEVQITDACAILCSAISLYVVPHAGVNSRGHLSPRKKRDIEVVENSPDSVSTTSSSNEDLHFQTFEHLVAHLSTETNAVGEHATKCIANILRPMEFDGSTTPQSEIMGPHGNRVSGFLRVLLQSIVSKMNESTQYAGFSPTFLLLQAVVTLAKLLALECGNRDVYNIVLPHLGSLVDAIEDVFRYGPRDDWVVRKRGIELLVQLIDLFVFGETAEANAGRAFFDENLERVRRLVIEARQDPVSVVRDAALPAVFLFDRLVKLFPRQAEVAAPPSPFKRVYSARGSGDGGSAGMKAFLGDSNRCSRTRARDARDTKEISEVVSHENETDQETDFDETHGDECATPHEDAATAKDDGKKVVPPLKLAPLATSVHSSGSPPQKAERVTTRVARSRIKIPRIAAPKSSSVERAFQPPTEDEYAFPEEKGDEHVAESLLDEAAATEEPQTTKQDIDVPTCTAQEEDELGEMPTMTRAEAAIVAATDGETDLALRLCFLEDDMTLLRRVLTLTRDPSASSLSRASRTALCAAFLEFLDLDDNENKRHDSGDMWLAFAWLKNLVRLPQFVQQLDPRVLRALELHLNRIAEIPNRAGLLAADLLHWMSL